MLHMTQDFQRGVLLCLQTRSIELTAPGTKPVVYSVRLVGHPDFSLETNTIRVDPGVPANLPFSYTATTTNSQVKEVLTIAMSRKVIMVEITIVIMIVRPQ